jgi:hypothetical protein
MIGKLKNHCLAKTVVINFAIRAMRHTSPGKIKKNTTQKKVIKGKFFLNERLPVKSPSIVCNLG